MQPIVVIQAGTMQMMRHEDEINFSHAMGVGELKAHLERSAVPGDCLLCEWFGRSTQEKI